MTCSIICTFGTGVGLFKPRLEYNLLCFEKEILRGYFPPVTGNKASFAIHVWLRVQSFPPGECFSIITAAYGSLLSPNGTTGANYRITSRWQCGGWLLCVTRYFILLNLNYLVDSTNANHLFFVMSAAGCVTCVIPPPMFQVFQLTWKPA